MASAATSERSAAGHHIDVSRNAVLLNGVRLASAEEKVARIDPLFNALRTRSGDPSEPDAPGQFSNPTPYTLTVEDDVGSAWFKSVFQTAAFAAQAPATLELEGAHLTLRPLVPLPPGAESPLTDPPWPEDVLIILVHNEHTEVWRAPLPASATEASSSTEPPESRQVARQPKDATVDELRYVFDAECSKGGCSPALVFIESPVPFSRFRRVLGALQTSVRAVGEANPVVELRIDEPSQLPMPPRAPTRMRVGATRVSGRLPRELIQTTVRANFAAFKQCYEAGLALDPKLTGRLLVRFVIDRNGRVPIVKNGGSDLPDSVVTCVLDAFRKVVFKEPEGGIVTVVYPIVFEPE